MAAMPAQTTAPGPKRRASRGRGDAEDGEAERRHGGEQSGDGAAHAEPVADLFEEGAEAGDGGAEVERGEHDADDDEPASATRAWRAGPARFPGGGRASSARSPWQRRSGSAVMRPGFLAAMRPIIESWDDWLSNPQLAQHGPRAKVSHAADLSPALRARPTR